MRIDVLTLFPEMFGVLNSSIIGRAQKKNILQLNVRNWRNFAYDKRGSVDDRPYGGGKGMVLRVDIADRAISTLKSKIKNPPTLRSEPRHRVVGEKSKIILLTPAGKLFNQKIARWLAKMDRLVLLCGHYEGFDERIRQLADEEISIGQYVLTGGELPAMVLIDAVVRLIPGVVGKKESLREESFSFRSSTHQLINSSMLLEYPQYTRPENYKGMRVPKILLSGNHQKIVEWRKEQALKKTRKCRRDLLT